MNSKGCVSDPKDAKITGFLTRLEITSLCKLEALFYKDQFCILHKMWQMFIVLYFSCYTLEVFSHQITWCILLAGLAGTHCINNHWNWCFCMKCLIQCHFSPFILRICICNVYLLFQNIPLYFKGVIKVLASICYFVLFFFHSLLNVESAWLGSVNTEHVAVEWKKKQNV